jgi:uncharacterized protein
MIRETIITTQSPDGSVHIAPMGVHDRDDELLIMPFRPSTTLDNLLAGRCAVVNYTDDVRIFAGCLTGRRQWPLADAERIRGKRLAHALAHAELKLIRIEEDEHRPRLYCRVLHEVNHKPFRGFNRAQSSVLEAAILVSRLQLLRWEKIRAEIDYLRIGVEKTAGPAEWEAWEWLMAAIEEFKSATQSD